MDMTTINSAMLLKAIKTAIPNACRISEADLVPGENADFSTNGDKEDTSGWLKVAPSGERAVFGDLRSGKRVEWQSPTATAEEEIKDWWEGLNIDDEKWIQDLTKEANNLPFASQDNPYLEKCHILPHGIREKFGFYNRPFLIVPVYDTDRRVHGYQYIEPDGSKQFRHYTVVEGHFFPIGIPMHQEESVNMPLVIVCAEFEKGARIHEATGFPVVCAFSSWNFKAVGEALKLKYPNTQIIICVKEDIQDISEAMEAAKVVGGLIALPGLFL